MKKANRILTVLLALTLAFTGAYFTAHAAASELLLAADEAVRDTASTASVSINYSAPGGALEDAALTGAYWYTLLEAGEAAPAEPQDLSELVAWATGNFGPESNASFLLTLDSLDPETAYALYVVAQLDGEGEDQLSNLVAVNIPPYVEDLPVKFLVNIIPPEAIADVANGAAKTEEGLGLPETVTLTVSDGVEESETAAAVAWDVENCAYDPALTAPQNFTVEGTAELPPEVENPLDLSLAVTVEVTVDGLPEGDDDADDENDDDSDVDGNKGGNSGGGNEAIQIVCTIGSTSYTVNGKQRTMAVAPYNNDGSPYLHVRVISEAIETTIGWDQDTQTVTLTSGNVVVKVTVGKTIIEINRDGSVTTEAIERAPQNVWPGAVMLPASTLVKIAEVFGYTLNVSVTADPTAQEEGDLFYVGTQVSQWPGKPDGRIYLDPQQAFDDAAAWSAAHGDVQVYVLVGVGGYTPKTQGGGKAANPAGNYFSLRDNIVVIGGFKGDENDLTPAYDQSDPAEPDARKTIFTGNEVCKSVFYHAGNGGTLQNAVIAGGNGGTNGGGGGMYNDQSPVILENCTFRDNAADNGGGMYNAPGTSPALNYCTFAGNTAANRGGGLYYAAPDDLDAAAALLTNCTFTANAARAGGGVWSAGALSLAGCIFTDNAATEEAGGLFGPVTTLDGCAFSLNKAKLGGAIHNGGDSILNNCTFADNAATEKGGGLFNASGSPTLTGCLFLVNEAVTGGGIYSEAGSPTLVNCTVFKNRAASGGGLYNNSEATLYNCLITLNYGNGANLTPDSDVCSGAAKAVTSKSSVNGGMFYDTAGVNTPILPAPALSDFEDSGALKPTAVFAIRQGNYELVTGYLPEDRCDITDALFYSDNAIDLGALRYTGPFVPVAAVRVAGANGATALTENGGALQLTAEVLPGDATNKYVAWRITSGASCAEINAAGLLQAVDNGTVTVRATAKDGSGKYGEAQFTISGQSQESPEEIEDVAAESETPPTPQPEITLAGASGVTLVSDATTPLALESRPAPAEVAAAEEPEAPETSANEENESEAPPPPQRSNVNTGALICAIIVLGATLGWFWNKRKQ